MNTIVANLPQQFSSEEIDDFVSFVLAGGEVTAAGLRDHAMKAKCIAFLREEKCLVGIAGLKLPRSTYRARVQESSGFSISEEAFPFELGWVFVLPSPLNH